MLIIWRKPIFSILFVPQILSHALRGDDGADGVESPSPTPLLSLAAPTLLFTMARTVGVPSFWGLPWRSVVTLCVPFFSSASFSSSFAPKAHLPLYPMELKLSELSPSSLNAHRVLKSPRPSLLFCNGTAQRLRLGRSPLSVSIRSGKNLHSIQSSISPSRYKKVAAFDPVSPFLLVC